MAETLKKLGESLPNGNVLTPLYTVPAARSAVLSTVMCCNQGSTPARFRLSHAVAGAADTPSQYLYFDEMIPAKKTFGATLGITMAASDVLRALSDTGLVSFNVYGSELS